MKKGNKKEIGEKELSEFKLFIVKESSKFSKSSTVCDFNDLEQAGFCGLISAYKHYDPKKGKWKTYAMYCIRNAIRSESIVFLKNITVPKAAATHYYKIKKLVNSGRSIEDIAEELSLSENYAFSLISLLDANSRDINFENSEVSINDNTEFINNVNEAFDKLNNEEKELLKLKCQYTFSEIGKKLDISYEWARKKYKAVCQKLLRSL